VSLREPTPQGEDTIEALECLICAAPVETADTCCSFDCTVAAEREMKRNVTLLKGYSGRQMALEERKRLTQRNGSLAAALLNWRPDPPPDV
jgi:hypothetical protein